MSTYIPIIQMILISGLIWLSYRYILKNQNNFKISRLYILFGTLLSLISFISVENTIINDIKIYELPTITISPEMASTTSSNISILPYIYWLPTCLFLIVFLIRLIKIAQFIHRSEKRTISGIKVHQLNQNHTAFNFFNRIFISKDILQDDSKQMVLMHEHSHSKHVHSMDVMIFEFLTIMFWFNPFFWLIKKELNEIHELQADRDVIKKGISHTTYQQQLLRYALLATSHTFAPSFSRLLVKRRIKVLNNNIKKKNTMKYILSLIAVFVIIQFSVQRFTFGVSESFNFNETELAQAEVEMDDNETIAEVKNKAEANDPQEECEYPLAVYKGGDNQLLKDIAKAIKYPDIPKEEMLEGRVFIQIDVPKSGDNIQFKVLKGLRADYDAAALAAIKTLANNWMPAKQDGKPVHSKFVLPIKFVK